MLICTVLIFTCYCRLSYELVAAISSLTSLGNLLHNLAELIYYKIQ